MIPPFDPAGYPGPRASGPSLVHDGAVHPLHLDGDDGRLTVGHGIVAHDPGDVPVLADLAAVRWSVAYGSNAAPARIVSKELDRDGALLLPARVLDHVPAYEHRRTGYGSVPLTLVPEPGAVIDTWVLGLLPSAMEQLDATEGRAPSGPRLGDVPDGGPADATTESWSMREPWSTPETDRPPPGTYQLAAVGEVAVADRFVLSRSLAYLPGPATRVQVTADGRWRTWPDADQVAAAAHLDEGGAHRPAPHTADPVVGPWPATPLADPPLFVYGTLRPGGRAHHVVADLVDVGDEASVPGMLYDTGRGYPAARFSAVEHTPGERVHGTLLVPRDATRAAELVRRCDAYEGLPPYERLAVRARTDGGETWALAYGWQDPVPPGHRRREGRWDPLDG